MEGLSFDGLLFLASIWFIMATRHALRYDLEWRSKKQMKEAV